MAGTPSTDLALLVAARAGRVTLAPAAVASMVTAAANRRYRVGMHDGSPPPVRLLPPSPRKQGRDLRFHPLDIAVLPRDADESDVYIATVRSVVFCHDHPDGARF